MLAEPSRLRQLHLVFSVGVYKMTRKLGDRVPWGCVLYSFVSSSVPGHTGVFLLGVVCLFSFERGKIRHLSEISV